ncbi:multidrug effflux MFS transporter [Sinosporangium siamense]|uniref:Bcr/CflA family drug resistance efflux transporter n=1 Tax=Sinosporangium siamense TaxID=1367973 RepID=A0A919RPI4_9ACTN|nr:multidrug effflux MFS transporter [Sinosporangium siamense]GII96635.1 Bcr/CflA family drug resistance efflux transporter [Sinosporangium siamense]
MTTAAAAAPQQTVDPVRRRRVLLLTLLGALSAIGPLTIDMYLPALPAITGEFGTGAAQVQLTLTASLIGAALGQVVVGPISDVRGRRGPLMISMIAYAVASVLCALSPSVYALVALRLIQGFTGGAALVIVRAIVRDLYSGPAIARVFASLMLVSGLAPMLAPIAGAEVLRFTSWRGIFVVLGVAGLVLLVTVLLWLKESLPAEERQGGGLRTTASTFWRLLRDRAFLGSALAGGLGFAGMFAYISASPFVLQDVYGVSPQLYSLIFALNALALVITAQIGGRLTGRVRPAVLVVSGLSAMVVGAGLLLAAVLAGAGLWTVVGGLMVLMAGLGLSLPGTTALALAGQPPQIAGSASALLGVMQFTLGGLAAPLSSVAGEGSALPMAVVITGINVLALVAFLALWRRPAAGPVRITEQVQP